MSELEHLDLNAPCEEQRDKLIGPLTPAPSASDGERITGVLRERREERYSMDKHLLAIADRIDAECERECHEQYVCGAEHGIGASIEASMIQDHGYIELPKDADGVPIHVGDVMKGEKIGGGFCEPFEVVGYIMSNGELEPMDEHKCPRKHKYLHHHKQPTVEDVLCEMLCAWEDTPTSEGVDGIIAKYAAKLQLKEQS